MEDTGHEYGFLFSVVGRLQPGKIKAVVMSMNREEEPVLMLERPHLRFRRTNRISKLDEPMLISVCVLHFSPSPFSLIVNEVTSDG